MYPRVGAHVVSIGIRSSDDPPKMALNHIVNTIACPVNVRKHYLHVPVHSRQPLESIYLYTLHIIVNI